MLRLWLGSLLFVAVLPGSVIVYVPYAITRWELEPAFFGVGAMRWLGVVLVGVSAPYFVEFLWRFVHDGRGTPAPVAPPKELVVSGSFRYTRNPGYVAVLGLILGQALFLGSRGLLAYWGGVWVMFHLWVLFYEEPKLRRQFGEAYREYCEAVPRWWPKRPAG